MPRYTEVIALAMALALSTSVRAQEEGGSRVSAVEHEGWRQYSVQCARCHGQDVLPNPVAANLLESTKKGGPMAEKEAFTRLVIDGRTNRGMPAFKGTLTAEQTDAIYAYVKGRADGRISAGRPAEPSGKTP